MLGSIPNTPLSLPRPECPMTAKNEHAVAFGVVPSRLSGHSEQLPLKLFLLTRGGKQVWRGRPLQRRRTAWSMMSAHQRMTWARRSAVRQQRAVRRTEASVWWFASRVGAKRRYRLCSVKGCGGVADISAEQRLRRDRGRRNLMLQKEDETESGSNGFSFSIHKKGPHCARVIQGKY